MSHAARAAQIENLVGELVELSVAQATDLREYAQATAAGEGTVNLKRAIRLREAQRAEVYGRFEQTEFALPQQDT